MCRQERYPEIVTLARDAAACRRADRLFGQRKFRQYNATNAENKPKIQQDYCRNNSRKRYRKVLRQIDRAVRRKDNQRRGYLSLSIFSKRQVSQL